MQQKAAIINNKTETKITSTRPTHSRITSPLHFYGNPTLPAGHHLVATRGRHATTGRSRRHARIVGGHGRLVDGVLVERVVERPLGCLLFCRLLLGDPPRFTLVELLVFPHQAAPLQTRRRTCWIRSHRCFTA